MALSTFIGQNLGAGEHERARRGARFGLISSVLLAELIGLIIFIFAEPFIRFFLSGPEAVAWGIEHCRTVALFFCLLAFSNCIAGVLRGADFPFALEILSAIPDDSRIAFYNFFSFLLSVFCLPNRL